MKTVKIGLCIVNFYWFTLIVNVKVSKEGEMAASLSAKTEYLDVILKDRHFRDTIQCVCEHSYSWKTFAINFVSLLRNYETYQKIISL